MTAKSAVTLAACLMILTATAEGSHALSIDSSFGTNGYVTLDASPTDETSFVVPGADGSSYVGVAPSTGAGGFVARLSADGTLIPDTGLPGGHRSTRGWVDSTLQSASSSWTVILGSPG